MHASVMNFGQRVLTEDVIKDRHVLEVGSYDVNGSLRGHVLAHRPATYFGIDMREGPGVDATFDITTQPIAAGVYDLIVCTEVMEHVDDWRTALENMVEGLNRYGHMLLTTRSPGFPLHDYPADHWRYDRWWLQAWMFWLGMDMLESVDDPEAPGVLMWMTRGAVQGRGSHPINPPHPAPTA